MKSLSNTLHNKNSRIIITALALILFSYLFIARCFELNFIQDDAYTSLRYAKNFSEGKGLVFNEGEKVEGYTNFLWVMMISGIAFTDKIFGLHVELDAAAQVLSTFFGVLIIWLAFFLAREINKNRNRNFLHEFWDLAPPFLISVSLPFIYWSVSGMETSLFVSLTLLMVILYLRSEKTNHSGIFFIAVSCLNSLLRPHRHI